MTWVGTFVCEFCADKHRKLFGSHTIKEVLREHWDDYQLRSVAIGGNKKFYEHLLEYEIERFDIATKYIHEAVVWYSGRHVAMMDDQLDYFKMAQPPRSVEEELGKLHAEVT